MTQPLSDYDLIAVRRGAAVYASGEDAVRAGPGACVALRKGVLYDARLDAPAPFEVLYAHYDYVNEAGHPTPPPPGVVPSVVRQLESPLFFHGLLERAIASEGEAAAAWLRVALMELLRQDAAPRWTGRDAETARRMTEMMEAIRRNPSGRWRVDELAREFRWTPDHFGRVFRRFAQESPGAFIVRVRIEEAMALLRTSAMPVTEIARRLGFSDIYAFSRQFRAKTGRSPTAYRRSVGPM